MLTIYFFAGIDRNGGKQGPEQPISSPWDLCLYTTPDMDMSFHHPGEEIVEKEVLLIAMAGTHQIWALFLEDTIWWKYKRYTQGTCICIAGSGREENRNNAYPQSAAFAQPSGLALNKNSKELYIADSESSTIRRMSLIDGKVSPVVGGEKNPLVSEVRIKKYTFSNIFFTFFRIYLDLEIRMVNLEKLNYNIR